MQGQQGKHAVGSVNNQGHTGNAVPKSSCNTAKVTGFSEVLMELY